MRDDDKYIDAGKTIKVSNNVHHPKHYALKGLEPYETVDVIKASVGDGFEGYCIGNVLKYVIRYKKKNGIEDLKKARVHLNWIIDDLENGHDKERV